MKIFMTGGAGFLGRAIMANMPDCDFTVYSRDSGKHQKLANRCRCLVGDVRDYDRLALAMAGHDYVVHAAAFKYVPQGEINVSEVIATNVDGSRNVARAAIVNGVKACVGISTDKACEPINVYGTTKQLMERIFLEANRMSDTEFNLVRYGNVVSSTDSVIPLFRRQIQEGRIMLTDPAMTRFWLSVGEAVELVRHALLEKTGGLILVPRLPAMTMKSLVEVVEGIYGDAKIEITGRRIGEKCHEQLVCKAESPFVAWDVGKLNGQAEITMAQIHDTVEGPLSTAKTRTYNSAEPDRFLSAEEMTRMIGKSSDVDVL